MGLDFSGQVWKNATFWSEIGDRDLEMRAAPPHQKFQGVPPRVLSLPPKVNHTFLNMIKIKIVIM